ncbi:MAG: hypothetical protein FJ109_11060 [Deltaproteobacteria bacterium]|nr:hypothetical protein [Deltaproteobacteria bacterium]
MQVGKSIGPYRLVDEVGRGMGTVFRAERPGSEGVSTVALKIFGSQGRLGRGSGLILWHRELEALCALQHPNVVRLVDFGEDEGSLYLATEFVEGTTLAEHRRTVRPGLAELLELVRQVASGLAHAHGQGVLHLDLKPDNILVAGCPPVARIVDFGLARFSAELRSGRTVLGGTFRYMAPELLREGRQTAGPRSDLYSLGVVLFEALTGCAPYDSVDPADLVRCKLTGAVRPLAQLLPGVPPPVDGLAARLLAVEPSDRPANAETVAEELQACLDLLASEGGAGALLEHHVRRPRKSPLEARFVGRSSELRALRATFDACQRGKGQIALVTGEQGIGKSRLASEFGQAVMASGGLFLCGRGTLMTRSTPYYPLLAAASEYLATSGAVGEAPAAGATEAVREKLVRLVDHLLGAGEGGALELEVDRGRERFFNLLMASLVGLAPPGTPLVLALDDFHWADPASIEFVERLAQRVERVPILVVCLYRKELVDRLSRLGRMAAGLEGAVSLLELPPLTADEVSDLVLDCAGFSPEAESGLQGYIGRHGRGNPLDTMSVAFRLLAREVVTMAEGRVAVDSERLARDEVVPASGEDAKSAPAASVLDSLDGPTRGVVGWASVIGDRFLPETLAAIASLSVEETRRLLDRACSTGVLRSTGGGQFGFSHDAFRESVYGLLEAEERKERHQRVGEVLEQAGEGQDPIRIPTLAEHFSRGKDLDKALYYSTAAGESSCRTHAHDSARRYLKASLLMLRAKGGASGENASVELRVRQALGDTYAATGEHEFAEREYERALELAPDDMARADLIGRKASVFLKRGELETAVSGMETALELLGVKMPRGRVPLLASMAWNAALVLLGELVRRRRHAGGSEPVDPADRLRIALMNKLSLLLFFFSMEKSLATHVLALRCSRWMPPCAESIETLTLHGPVICSVPAPRRALQSAYEAVDMGKELGQPGPLMVALFYAGVTNHFLGRWCPFGKRV